MDKMILILKYYLENTLYYNCWNQSFHLQAVIVRIDNKFTLFHLTIKSHSVTIQMKISLIETLQRTLCTVYHTLYET